MCSDSRCHFQCPGCKVLPEKIDHTRQVLAELHEKMDSGDYSIKDLPSDAQLGFKALADLVKDILILGSLAPELDQVGRSLYLHLEAFNQEIEHMEGLAPG
jgi:hypothetical protein